MAATNALALLADSGYMSAALVIIALTMLGALLLGLRDRGGREMSLEQWTVGGLTS